MYLARRFPDCQLWWPSVDEDVTVQSLSSRPGKSLLLEVKTTDWNWRRWEHRLAIDVNQLSRYQHSAVPVYYVLPMPPWSAVLTDGHSWLKGRPRSELINSGHGWFGDWVFVTRAQTLWAWLGHRCRQESATLFVSRGGTCDPSQIWPELWPWWTWSDFWDGMARCGSQDMPAMFTISAGPHPSAAGLGRTRETLVQRLTSSRGDLGRERLGAGVERFIPVEDDGYRLLAEPDVLELPLTSGAAGRSTALIHLNLFDLIV